MHAPMKEAKEYSDTILLTDNPQILQLVALSHVLKMIFNEIINVFTKDVHVGVSQDSLVILRIYYKLKEKHEQQEEWLKNMPSYCQADQPCELEETISNADVSFGVQWLANMRA